MDLITRKSTFEPAKSATDIDNLNSTVVSLLLNARGSRAVMIKDNWTTETADFQEYQPTEHDMHRHVLHSMRWEPPYINTPPRSVVGLRI